ncbi:DUF2255 family protein [Microbacterium sp. 13-71-7]|uniref:DUF2255 family protein n=1 Tax=Microbacterium sp. 13-71-7 TaxID=1970399 RepID=UPI000BD95000|nr:DUF2255 family protein [Microbacterium sp. 13-71-7]OZB85839.1 MAG: hypothetical protein B7X32_01770 [Microbacterium sp. 13-71-7]
MSTWTDAELTTVDAVDELYVASVRPDGTMTRPVTIWAVRVDDRVYLRSVHGRGANWFKATRASGLGHVSIGGVERDVIFTEITDDAEQAQISQAYQAKYGRYAKSIVDSTRTPDALAATLLAIPR